MLINAQPAKLDSHQLEIRFNNGLPPLASEVRIQPYGALEDRRRAIGKAG
jgi:hypothetical protein